MPNSSQVIKSSSRIFAMLFFLLIAIGAVIAALTGSGRLYLLIVAGAAFALAVRYYWVGIETNATGIVVRGEVGTRRVSWSEIDKFKLANWLSIRYIESKSGRERGLIFFTSSGDRRSPEAVVEELNVLLDRARTASNQRHA